MPFAEALFLQLLLRGGCGMACGAMQAACPAGTQRSAGKCGQQQGYDFRVACTGGIPQEAFFQASFQSWLHDLGRISA